MGNLARSWSLFGRGEELGLHRLEQVAELADKLDGRANDIGATEHPGITGDLRHAASELRLLVFWLLSAMEATESDAVISLDAESRVVVNF